MAGCKVKEVYTGIAGGHIKSKDSNGMTVVRDKEVTQYDVERAIEAANATPISADDQILHTLVQEFIVDGQDGVKEPIGMDAKRLEVKVHLVTGAVTAVQNIVKCVHRCGLEVVDLVLQPLASGIAVLTDDEKDVGVCLVDIGGGTTDIAVFTQGAIRHTAVIPDRRRPDHQRTSPSPCAPRRRTPRKSRFATASRSSNWPIPRR